MTTVPAQPRSSSPSSSFPPRQSWPGSPLRTAVGKHISALQRGYRDDRPDAVAALARLRRGVGKPLYASPDLWGLIGMERLLAEIAELPPSAETDKWREPRTLDRAEAALHVAVPLWALHAQSRRDADAHLWGYGLGRSVRELMRRKRGVPASTPGEAATSGQSSGQPTTDDIDEPLRRRFVRIAAATSLDGLAQRLREVVLLMRTAGVALDYALLADQILRWQEPGGPALVHRHWGRDFHLAAQRRAPAADAAGPDTGTPEDDLLPTAD